MLSGHEMRRLLFRIPIRRSWVAGAVDGFARFVSGGAARVASPSGSHTFWVHAVFLVFFRNSHFNNDCPAEGSGLMCLSLELTVFSCVFSLGRCRGLHVLGLERAGRSPGRLSFTEPRIVAFRMRVPTYVGASISFFYCCLCFVIIGI